MLASFPHEQLQMHVLCGKCPVTMLLIAQYGIEKVVIQRTYRLNKRSFTRFTSIISVPGPDLTCHHVGRLCLPYERHERGLPESALAPPPPLSNHRTPLPPAAPQTSAPVPSAAGRGRKRSPSGAAEAAAVALLAQARPAITNTPVAPRPPPAGYTALQSLSSMARQTEAKRPRLEAPPPPAHQGVPRRSPAGGPVEVIDLTTGGVRSEPPSEPARIGAITITPVEKGASPPAEPGPADPRLALHNHMAPVLPAPLLQYMGLLQAGGKERLQRLQQQQLLQSVLAQRLVLLPPGLSPEQADWLEAYQRLLQAGLRRS